MFVKIPEQIGEEYNPFTNTYDTVYDTEKTETVYVAPTVHKNINLYNKKAIICNNVIEIIEYKEPVFEGFEVNNKGSTYTGKKSTTTDKRSNNINQSKMNLRRLINANTTNKDLFITLTYKENMCNIDVAKKDFKNFVKRWNYNRRKEGFEPLRYVYVVEFQKRGAVHFHSIFFNVGYIKNKELNSLWSHGFVKVNKIDKVDNVGAYVVKYMQKDLIDSRLNNRDLYGRSKNNLNEPLIIKNPQEVAILENSLNGSSSGFSSGSACVYSKTFDSEHYGTITYKQYNLKRV